MAIDPSHAAFVSQEYRYQIATDVTVKANYGNAAEVSIDTQLNSTDAATLATALLATTKTLAQVYEVEIDGVLNLEDFDGTVNRYTVSFPRYSTDGRTFKLIGAEIDYVANITTLRIRG